MMQDLDLIKTAASAASAKKAINIKSIKVADISSVANYFLLASGNNPAQVKAIADEIEVKLGESGIKPERTEGYKGAVWIILDYADVVIHVFHKDTRNFYDLERLWADGEVTEFED
jgi:ribosome-associated protein